MTEENEITEHIIEIDNYLSATIKIPKKLTAIELKALMMKANKLFNLSETPLIEKRRYTRQPTVDNKGKLNLINKYKGLSDEEKQKLADSMGLGNKALYQRVWKFKKELEYPSRKRYVSHKKYSDELITDIVNELKKGRLAKEIASEKGMTNKVMYDLIFNRTKRTPSSFKKEGNK